MVIDRHPDPCICDEVAYELAQGEEPSDRQWWIAELKCRKIERSGEMIKQLRSAIQGNPDDDDVEFLRYSIGVIETITPSELH